MIDTSYSQRRLLPLTKSTARVFVTGFIRPGRDRAAIISFADAVTISQPSTDDVESLRASLDQVKTVSPYVLDVSGGKLPQPQRPTGSTGLFDAIIFACDKVLDQRVGGARKAIIVFTDGVDSSSTSKTRAAIESAVKNDVAIYAIGFPGNFTGGAPGSLDVDREKLRRLSEETGGRAYFPGKNEELESILSRIEQHLRVQYIVSFRSRRVTDHRDHNRLKIELVSLEKKKNVQLAYRRTY